MKKKTLLISAAVAVVVLGGAGVAVAAIDPFDDNDRLTGTTLERASEAALAEVGEGTVREAESSNDLDHAYLVEVRLTDGSEADVALDENFAVVWVDTDRDNSDDRSGAGVAGTDSAGTNSAAPTSPTNSGNTNSGNTDDLPLTDAERSSAEAAALAEVGSGTVTDIDRSDDADHAFEVEVTQADGTDVDVELDSNFAVVRVDNDSF